MKTTINTLGVYNAAFNEIGKLDCPGQVGYWCFINQRELTPHIQFFYQERDKVFREYLKPDKEGNYFTLDEYGKPVFDIRDNKEREFYKKINDLEEIEFDFDIHHLTLKDVVESHPDWSFKPIYFEQLHDFIKD